MFRKLFGLKKFQNQTSAKSKLDQMTSKPLKPSDFLTNPTTFKARGDVDEIVFCVGVLAEVERVVSVGGEAEEQSPHVQTTRSGPMISSVHPVNVPTNITDPPLNHRLCVL